MNTKLLPEDADQIESLLCGLGHTWTATILIQLSSGAQRTKTVLENLPGLSAKTFTERVRSLERHGLVTRTSYREVPPRVEYNLTDSGNEIVNVLKSVRTTFSGLNAEELENWGRRYW